MKKTFFTGLFFYFSLASYSQEISSGVPAKVILAFNKEFSNIAKVQWEKTKGNIYRAVFHNGKDSCAAYLDWLGILLQTEIVLRKEEIPNSILTYLRQNYPSFTMSAIRKTDRGNGWEYRVLMDSYNKSKHELLFDENGNFIREFEPRDFGIIKTE